MDNEELAALRRRVKAQRAELRRLNKYLGPYWAGFRAGLRGEAEMRLRGIMNARFGHNAVLEAEQEYLQEQHDKAKALINS